MGYFNEMSIDTRTCGQADEDAWLDRRDGLTSSAAPTHMIAAIEKEIVYSRQTRDFDLYITIDGKREYIGSAATYGAGEERCNMYVYDYLTDSHTIETAAELLMQVAA